MMTHQEFSLSCWRPELIHVRCDERTLLIVNAEDIVGSGAFGRGVNKAWFRARSLLAWRQGGATLEECAVQNSGTCDRAGSNEMVFLEG